jgi:ribosomal protein L34E
MSVFEKHKCDKCGRKFRKVEQLMQHQQVAHEQSLYICNQCNMSFEGMERMRDHAKKFHSYHHHKRTKEKRTTRQL